jgi:hypothetical protein
MKAILNIINSICAAIFSGYVFSVLWGWFIVSTFGLPAIGIAVALGIILVARYATMVPRKLKEEDAIQGVMWFKPLFALLVGFILKSFM